MIKRNFRAKIPIFIYPRRCHPPLLSKPVRHNMETVYLAIISTMFFLLIHCFLRSRRDSPSWKLPPGPMKLPIIGSMYCLLGSLPHRRLAELANEYGPLMHVQLGQVPFLVVSSIEAAKEIFKTHDIAFSGRPQPPSAEVLSYGFKGLGFAPYGSYWRQIKKLYTVELLSSRRVRSFRSIREEETWKLVQSIAKTAPSSTINLSEELRSLANNIVARAAIGEGCKEQRKLLRLIKEGLEQVGAFNLVDFYPSSILVRTLMSKWRSRLLKCHEELDKILQDVLDKHRMRKRVNEDGGAPRDKGISDEPEDLLQILLKIQEDGGLDSPLGDDNIKAIILDAFVAGTDTSSTTLEWAMSEMIRNPNIMRKAQEELRNTFKGKSTILDSDMKELSYLKMVIMETLRMHPPAPLSVPRECIETCNILGYKISNKTTILINLWAIGNDCRHWEDPEVFKPERFSSKTIDFLVNDFVLAPFGGGRRICPGISFGVATMELALASLLYYFDWMLPHGVSPDKLDMDETIGLTCSRKISLQLVALPFISILDS